MSMRAKARTVKSATPKQHPNDFPADEAALSTKPGGWLSSPMVARYRPEQGSQATNRRPRDAALLLGGLAEAGASGAQSRGPSGQVRGKGGGVRDPGAPPEHQ
jgi:hypothetical protein